MYSFELSGSADLITITLNVSKYFLLLSFFASTEMKGNECQCKALKLHWRVRMFT